MPQYEKIKIEGINKNQREALEEYKKIEKLSKSSLIDLGAITSAEFENFHLLPREKEYKKILARINDYEKKLFIFEKKSDNLMAIFYTKIEQNKQYEIREFFNIPNEHYKTFVNVKAKYLIEENKIQKLADFIVTDALNPENIIERENTTKQENLTNEQQSAIKSGLFNHQNVIVFEKIKTTVTGNLAQKSAKKDYENFQKNGMINAKTTRNLYNQPYQMEIWENIKNPDNNKYKAFIKDGEHIIGTIDYVNEDDEKNRFFETIFNVFNPTQKRYENQKKEQIINENNELEQVSETVTDPKTNEILDFYDLEKISKLKKDDPITKVILKNNETIENIFKKIKNK
ncbi:MAG: hypothetical protein US76_03280 [Parcubacteria group bacterium GW2011_GWA2_38_13b]|nr:MAG: hypothetical protein US76_03280 [Parcubacteria group bacterium GW2011_GWA2_38_13b]